MANLKTYRNTRFVKRDYECTNIVACVAEAAPGPDWEETYDAFWVGLDSLYIQAGVKYYGYL